MNGQRGKGKFSGLEGGDFHKIFKKLKSAKIRKIFTRNRVIEMYGMSKLGK